MSKGYTLTGNKKGLLFVISAPSGTGKTTLCKEILRQHPHMQLSVSCTTRPIREGELEGKDYYFINKERFRKLADEGGFAEWAEVHGELYGTTVKTLNDAEESGVDLLLDIDWQGAKQIKKNLEKGIYIFILPPSIEELRKRLSGRGDVSADVMERRLKNAATEIEQARWYNYNIINDDLETAKKAISSIVIAEHYRSDEHDR
ncbi:MAG: guanylate kinase [Proteobacteria bacterium]|nr:guanylate kinase [Pseudomonadota bacterium]